MARETITVDQVGCARCLGEGHDGLVFEALDNPSTVGDFKVRWWAMCPTTNQPIFRATTTITPIEDPTT